MDTPDSHAEPLVGPSPWRSLLLLSGVLLAPLSWFAQMEIKYALVPAVCRSGERYGLHVVGALFFVPAIAGMLAAIANVRAARSENSQANARLDAFVGKLGLMTSAIFVLLIIGQEVASIIMSPCPP
jgi:hypothetical protein